MALNLVQQDSVLPYLTGGGLSGPFGAILGPFLRDFRAQSKIFGPDWSLFLTHLAAKNDFNSPKTNTGGQESLIGAYFSPVAAKNDFNGPKTDTVGQGNYHTGLVGVFRAHFGPFWKPFWRDIRPQSKIVGPVWSLFLTRLAAKNDFNGPK